MAPPDQPAQPVKPRLEAGPLDVRRDNEVGFNTNFSAHGGQGAKIGVGGGGAPRYKHPYRGFKGLGIRVCRTYR